MALAIGQNAIGADDTLDDLEDVAGVVTVEEDVLAWRSGLDCP